MRCLLLMMLAVGLLARVSGPVVLHTPESAELMALCKQLLAAALNWQQADRAFFSTGEDPGPDWYVMMSAVRDSRLAIAKTKQQRIEALKTYLTFANANFRQVDALYRAGARGGEEEELQRRRLQLIDAKIMLLHAEQQDSPR